MILWVFYIFHLGYLENTCIKVEFTACLYSRNSQWYNVCIMESWGVTKDRSRMVWPKRKQIWRRILGLMHVVSWSRCLWGKRFRATNTEHWDLKDMDLGRRRRSYGLSQAFSPSFANQNHLGAEQFPRDFAQIAESYRESGGAPVGTNTAETGGKRCEAKTLGSMLVYCLPISFLLGKMDVRELCQELLLSCKSWVRAWSCRRT